MKFTAVVIQFNRIIISIKDTYLSIYLYLVFTAFCFEKLNKNNSFYSHKSYSRLYSMYEMCIIQKKKTPRQKYLVGTTMSNRARLFGKCTHILVENILLFRKIRGLKILVHFQVFKIQL